jgi:hypothetical protein
MSEACQYLHDQLAQLARLQREDLPSVPGDGIYVLFEKGEHGHGGDRIVRVGTHRGQGNLPGRIREHLYTPNKDRSIFRKHVGRCLLNREKDPFLVQWELDLTTKIARCRDGDRVDRDRLQKVEAEVTRYMVDNFSFTTLRFDSASARRDFEEHLLSTIYACPDCGPSEHWLGRFHPTSDAIRTCGLWNVQGLRGKVLSLSEVQDLVRLGSAVA